MEEILFAIDEGRNVILTGPGGCGKTHSIRFLTSALVDMGRDVGVTSTTGISAINLNVPEKSIVARTLHSYAGIGLAQGTPEELYAKVFNNRNAYNRIRNVEILFLDEFSMLGAELFEKVDYVFRYVRRKINKPMGGVILVASGDVLQLPPVKEQFVFKCDAWKKLKFKPFFFEDPKRYNDLDFFHLLQRLRKSEHTGEDIQTLKGRVVAYENYKKAIEGKDPSKVLKPTMFHSRKMEVATINKNELEKLEGPEFTFMAQDTFTAYKDNAKRELYFKSLEDNIPQYINLKVGAQVMLRKNIDIERGLVNGSRGVITAITSGESVKVSFVNGISEKIGMQTWKIKDKRGIASRTQIPFILAWACTIHKAQGATCDLCVCNIGSSIFTEGQAYVALSRVRNLKGLFLSDFYPKAIKTNEEALEYNNKLAEEATYVV